MPRTSCVIHTDQEDFLIIRRNYYELTGDHCAAALLAVFEFFTNGEYAKMERDDQQWEPWITVSRKSLSDAMISLFSPRKVFESLRELESRGLVTLSPEPPIGECRKYLLNIEALNDFARAKLHKCKIARVQNCTKPVCNSAHVLVQNCTVYKEEESKEEYQEERTLPTLPDQNQIQAPEEHQVTEETRSQKNLAPPAENSAIQSTSYDVQLDESIEVFVANAYRQSRGAKVAKSDIRKLTPTLQDEERSWGPEALRGALWNYLAESSDWLREQKWPLRNFLRQISKYVPNEAEGRASASRQANWYTGYPRTPEAVKQPATCETDPKKTNAYYLDTWNAIVDNRPVGKIADYIEKDFEKSLRSESFRDRFEEICRKCRALIDAGQDYTFEWLFGGFEPQWKKVLSGQYNWQLQKKPASAGANSSDAWLEKIAREENGK